MNGARVLDAGCGTGGLLRRLKLWEPDWLLEGVDISPLACQIATQIGANMQCASVTQLPYPPNHFDAILCGDVLYHLDKPLDALCEFQRCLRPGGMVAINVPAYRCLWSYHDERVESKHRFSRRDVLELLHRAGLRPVFSTYWNTLPFPLIVARRKLFPPRSNESDVKLSAPPVEVLLNAAMLLERSWNRLGLRLPFGSSVFAVARKE